MKIRSGFVSNSSSSSFIIAYNDKDKCSHCGRGSSLIVESFLNMACEDKYCDDTKLLCRNIEEVKNYFINYYGEKDDDGNIVFEDWELKTIEKMKEHVNNGYNILMVQVSHNDGIICDMIRNDKNLIVIDKG